jgi:hypothetical protein
MDPQALVVGDRVHLGWLGGTVRKVTQREGRWCARVKFDIEPEPRWVAVNELQAYGDTKRGRR